MAYKQNSSTSLRAGQFILALGDLVKRLQYPSSPDQSNLKSQFEELISSKDIGIPFDPLLFYQISKVLQGGENPTMKELGEALRIPKATLTRIVDLWVRQGIVERFDDPGDRRIVRVGLTERGGQLREIMLEYGEKRVGNVLSSLTKEEQIALISLLNKLAYS